MKKDMKEEIRELWAQLENKTAFASKIAPLVERSERTIYRHWFSTSPQSPGLPSDKRTLTILKRELKKAPKK